MAGDAQRGVTQISARHVFFGQAEDFVAAGFLPSGLVERLDHLWWAPSSTFERVQQQNPCALDIDSVPGRQDQAADDGGCGEQAIDRWQGIRDIQPHTLIGDGFVDGRDPIAKPGSHAIEPEVHCLRLDRVVAALEFVSPTNFAKNDDTRTNVLGLDIADQRQHIRACLAKVCSGFAKKTCANKRLQQVA
jgi:hypothetical protein